MNNAEAIKLIKRAETNTESCLKGISVAISSSMSDNQIAESSVSFHFIQQTSQDMRHRELYQR